MYDNAVYWTSYFYDEKNAYYSHVIKKFCGKDDKDEKRVLCIKKAINDDVECKLYFIEMDE